MSTEKSDRSPTGPRTIQSNDDNDIEKTAENEKNSRNEHENIVSNIEEMSTIILISKEGEEFEVPFLIVKLSKVLVELKQERNNERICMETPTISSKVLSELIKYGTYYIENPMKPIQLPLYSLRLSNLVQEWYAEYINSMEWELLLQMVNAANFLDIKPLLQLCCLGVVSKIVGRNANEVRPMFGIQNPDGTNGEWTNEQIGEVRRENEWAFIARQQFIEKMNDDENGDYDASRE